MARILIGEFGYQRNAFRHFDSLMKKSLMTVWFRENFEDPWNNLHYDRDDGWVWGDRGPFYAHDELEETFGDVVGETDILEAVLEIEKGGHIWARREEAMTPSTKYIWTMKDVYASPPFEFEEPYWLALKEHTVKPYEENPFSSSQAPTHDESEDDTAGLYTFADHSFAGHSFAGPAPERYREPAKNLDAIIRAERTARLALQRELTKAKAELRTLTAAHPRNHNKPPEELEIDRELAAQVTNISITIDNLEVNLAAPQPNLAEVKEGLSLLRSVMKWCGARMTASVDVIVPAVALVYASSPEQVNALAERLYNASIVWLDAALRLIS